MPLASLIDLLAQKTHQFTQLKDKEEYDTCKESIRQIQLEIEQRQLTGKPDKNSSLSQPDSPPLKTDV